MITYMFACREANRMIIWKKMGTETGFNCIDNSHSMWELTEIGQMQMTTKSHFIRKLWATITELYSCMFIWPYIVLHYCKVCAKGKISGISLLQNMLIHKYSLKRPPKCLYHCSIILMNNTSVTEFLCSILV
jgi:hypothetical protein